MTIQHVDIVDPHIHEPKGVSAADEFTVYVADGNGSGSWELVGADSLDFASISPVLQQAIDEGDILIARAFELHGCIPDVSTPGSVYVPVPESATVTGALFVLGGSITGADAEITLFDSTSASLGAPVTIEYASSAAGDQYQWTATTNNELTGPTHIRITTDGGSTDAAPLYFTVQFVIPLPSS